jgi:hypothetical protein
MEAEGKAWLEVGKRVLLEETETVVVDGRRRFADDGSAGYESMEVEAVLSRDEEYGHWEAEPDWSTLRYVTYPVTR